MKIFEKRTFQIVVVAGAVAVIGLLTPKAAHAIAAALVQVTNGFNNPVISQQTTTAASQIVVLQVPLNATISPGTNVTMNQFLPEQGPQSLYSVPSGQNLVVTGMDVTNTSSAGSFIELFSGSYQVAEISSTAAGTNQAHFNPGLVYPAGSTVIVKYPTGLGGGGASIVIYGYLTAN